jgi:putative glutamine amidotransferase
MQKSVSPEMEPLERQGIHPVIGVTTSRRSGYRIFPLMALNLRLAGGRGVRWDTSRDADIQSVDGLICGGGDDIAPELYRGELVGTARLDPERDELERRLILEALEANKPVLGICRGAQMLNVALGGSLHQDAYGHYVDSPKVRTILPRKTLAIVKGTLLARCAGTEPMRVNALHTQSVDRLADGLRVAAIDEGDMVQAIERTTDPFALGVQWHPEHLFYARRQRALFRALVTAAWANRIGAFQIRQAERDAAA